MVNIYVHLQSLQQAASECQSIAVEVGHICNSFNQRINQLEQDIRSMSSIDETADSITTSLTNYINILHEASQFLKEAQTIYEELDNPSLLSNLVPSDSLKGGDIQ